VIKYCKILDTVNDNLEREAFLQTDRKSYYLIIMMRKP
jgi:hypothetical protein